ncbi:hypothetical protein TRFO_38274 [Tritrichomonas foetus]|uniref:BEACH domain-containing protein n=1 Tax=Tritrichomonas foetus TaxID=1144522 RepID=A0A1J4JEC6_9EUKA|nr:hypothetical protein TRFO_38274 [Tritrichomonas foetus]|eukprot:OHS95612.1 hypothetical protein TRFO_38274 [Tritrichomonas foetus]
MNQIRLKQSANSKKVSNTSQPKLKPETFFSAKCMVIKITGETPAEFSLCTDRFLLTTAYSQKVVMLSEIRHILRRNRFQIPNSLEFILVNGRSLLLDFTPLGSKAILRNFRNLRCENLKSFQILSPKEYFEKSGLTEKWKTRQISNFEYLMALNIYGGRSFNDSNLYPIFPWIVTKFFGFESNSLSFSQSIEFDAKKEPIDIKSEVRRSSSFTLYSRNEQRNLNLPIAIQTPEKYDELKVKFSNDEPINHTNCFFLVAPSNTAMVAHWLIRQPPFTQLHWKTEDGRFGFSARLFQSINRAAYQALRGSISWELCPEFFCFPEVFVNMNGYKMGENVDDVFPLETAIDFVYFHRKFLESEEVSMNLNGWIDLIFGKKIYSIDTGNVYSPILSEDAWASQISKDYPKGFIVETLKTSGQLPQNMFSELHPKRNPFTTMKMNITCKVNSELHSINHVKYLKKLDDEMVFLISNDNGSICTALVNFDAKVCRSEFPVYQNGDINRVKGDLFVNFLNGFCVFDQINSEFYIVKNSTLEQISCAEDVDFAYGSNDAICIGNNKGVFEYFLLNDMSIDPIRFNFLYDRVSCFTFSLSFGVIIYGSVTGFIYISDIKTGQISFHSSLEGKCPKKIFVTDGFGFIVVYCDDFSVFLFNINGFFIRKVKFVTPMRNMSVFKSNNGFDYMVVVDMKGAIKLCEVFYLDFGDVLFNCRAEIVALDYDSSADAILAVSKNGSFFRIQAKTCQTLSG